MRFWVSGPRILGHRTGVSFGPEDFRRLGAPRATSQSGSRAAAWIYVVKSATGHVKIGITADPLARLASLQTGSSQKLELVYTCGVKSNDGYAVEQAAHAVLWKHRLEGEWFDTTPEMAVAAIAAASHRLNDPIVEIPKDKIPAVLAIAAMPDAPSRGYTRRQYWLWFTVPTVAFLGVVAISAGGDPAAGFATWLVVSLAFSTAIYGLLRLFRVAS